MEAIYNLIVGQVNCQDPSESFRVQLFVLRVMGLWSPDTNNQTLQTLYTIWSYFYRWFFLYLYTLTQILFFINVEDLKDVADASFLLLTQLTLVYKLNRFYKNRHRIKACEKLLRSDLFRPTNHEENAVVKSAMIQSFAFCMSFLTLAHLTISAFAISPFLEPEMRLPIAAWYPFSTDNKYIFALVYFYQIFGVSMSACYNSSTDTFSSALIAHANAQVQRLGIQLAKIGHDQKNDNENENPINNKNIHLKLHQNLVAKTLNKFIDESNAERNIDAHMAEINRKVHKLKEQHSTMYADVVRCIILHENILNFAAEIQDIFKGPIFAQLMSSVIIICMTCFMLINQIDNFVQFGSTVAYLITMITQILLFCWIGNELIYSSRELSQQAYFSNFQAFDKPTAKAMLCFMQRTIREIQLKAGGAFQVTLSLPTFMGIIKSSYSYFAVLQSMQEQK